MKGLVSFLLCCGSGYVEDVLSFFFNRQWSIHGQMKESPSPGALWPLSAQDSGFLFKQAGGPLVAWSLWAPVGLCPVRMLLGSALPLHFDDSPEVLMGTWGLWRVYCNGPQALKLFPFRAVSDPRPCPLEVLKGLKGGIVAASYLVENFTSQMEIALSANPLHLLVLRGSLCFSSFQEWVGGPSWLGFPGWPVGIRLWAGCAPLRQTEGLWSLPSAPCEPRSSHLSGTPWEGASSAFLPCHWPGESEERLHPFKRVKQHNCKHTV